MCLMRYVDLCWVRQVKGKKADKVLKRKASQKENTDPDEDPEIIDVQVYTLYCGHTHLCCVFANQYSFTCLCACLLLH